MPPVTMAARERRIVGTSLKMYFDLPRTKEYVRGVAALDATACDAGVDLFVIPDFVSIIPSAEILKETSIKLGAQDVYWEDSGAHTGEVSPVVLKQAGAQIVELNHAERRARFGETDETTAKKVGAAYRNGLIPLVCIGEKKHSNIVSEAVGMAITECRAQVNSIIGAAPDDADLILAYEPVWAIGANEPADPQHVVFVTQEIRKMVSSRKGRTRILYGGSAGPGTYKALVQGVDGLFLGRFAHDIDNLKQVIKEVAEAQ